MRISILQTDIVWENKQENLRRLREKLETLRGTTEIVVLPETFSTGFSMDTASLAEPTTGETIATLRQWSEEYRLALAGSYIACETASEGGKPSYYNRAFFLTPEGNAYYYDKRHLFRMGHETEHFTPGNRRPIIRYRGWNILLLVCYDLRFPEIFSAMRDQYEVIMVIANWPETRAEQWETLLKARAIENQAYVIAVNRVGDGDGLHYIPSSHVYDWLGRDVSVRVSEKLRVADIDPGAVRHARTEFPQTNDRKNTFYKMLY